MFANNRELFDFIRSLVEKLDTIEENQWSSSFKDAMNISFMPGEVLGELRGTLRNFKETKFPKQLNVETEIEAALESLDEALRPRTMRS
ncbi:MAG TPA: hypothetical protein VFR47_26655 [Anaerolineales bacterium]|nr:hypothetical protein [Anaerolineales bacterium]